MIQTQAEFQEMLDVLSTSKIICLDTETVGLYGDLMGLAFATMEGMICRTWYLPVGHPSYLKAGENVDFPWKGAITDLLLTPGIEWVFHNAMYDLDILAASNLPDIPDEHIWDTLLMAHLENENRFSFELDALAKEFFAEEKVSLQDYLKVVGGDYGKVPPALMSPYAQKDVDLTLRSFYVLHARLESVRLEKDNRLSLIDVYRDLAPYIKAIGRIKSTGLLIDTNKCADLSREARQELAQIKAHLGFDPGKDAQVRKHLFSDVGLPVLPGARTDKGAPQTDTYWLSIYSREFPHVKDTCQSIIRYRNVSKALSTWYEGFPKQLGKDGRLHPGFKIHGTKTSRLACAKPNTQQIPRGGPVKGLFHPPPGYKLWELDYSGQELRVAASYASEELMLKVFREGGDLHDQTARLIDAYSYSPENGRQVGKRTNFLLLYGGQGKRLQTALWQDAKMNIPLDVCNDWATAFRASYANLTEFTALVNGVAATRGYIEFWNGRHRRFYFTNKAGRQVLLAKEARKGFNSLVQGGCGGILQDAIIKIHHHPDLQEVQVVNTVHDSIWVNIPEGHEDHFIPILKRVMRETPEDFFKVPFEIEEKLLATAMQ